MNIALYVQHLLGTGHLVRTKLLAEAMHNAGHQVTLINGGICQPEKTKYHTVQLPPLKTNPGDFRILLDEYNNAVDSQWKDRRKVQLLNIIDSLSVDVMVIETWPFGRKQMEFEILPFVKSLTARKKPPLMVSSIRDILQIRSPEKHQQTLKRLDRYFNLVLIHGDPQIATLDASFPELDDVPCAVEYSGYITTKTLPPNSNSQQSGEILVSAGGGVSGIKLLRTAVDASKQDERPWRLLVGHNLNETNFEQLSSQGADNLTVERNRTDFQTLLTQCDVSISQFGYNTALDLIHSQCKAVVVPYAEGGETEQSMRANCFAEKNQVIVQPEETLTPMNLLIAMHKATNMIKSKIAINTEGATTSVKIIEKHLKNLKQ